MHKIVILLVCALLVGCSTASDHEGTYTAMVGPEVRLSSTAAYGLASNKVAQTGLEKPYFIEFRARNAYSYGHAYVVFGVLNEKGEIPLLFDKDEKGILDPRYTEIAGLHPGSNYVTPFVVGHVVPVPAESGPSDGDEEERYVTERYRVDLTQQEFDALVEVIKYHKRRGVVWNAPIYSCVHFLSHIADDMGLKTPEAVSLPDKMVRVLAELNGKNPQVKIRRMRAGI